MEKFIAQVEIIACRKIMERYGEEFYVWLHQNRDDMEENEFQEIFALFQTAMTRIDNILIKNMMKRYDEKRIRQGKLAIDTLSLKTL